MFFGHIPELFFLLLLLIMAGFAILVLRLGPRR